MLVRKAFSAFFCDSLVVSVFWLFYIWRLMSHFPEKCFFSVRFKKRLFSGFSESLHFLEAEMAFLFTFFV